MCFAMFGLVAVLGCIVGACGQLCCQRFCKRLWKKSFCALAEPAAASRQSLFQHHEETRHLFEKVQPEKLNNGSNRGGTRHYELSG